MKRILSILSVFTVLLFMSCEGPQGPPGFDGFDGFDGQPGQDAEVIPSFETQAINFTSGDNYEAQVSYPFNMFPDDMALVYVLWDNNGQDIWRLLPQTIPFDDGSLLIYNFDFTTSDVLLFLDGTTDLNTLAPEYTQNQIFRIVVIPAIDFGRVNFTNLDTVIEMYNIKEFKKL